MHFVVSTKFFSQCRVFSNNSYACEILRDTLKEKYQSIAKQMLLKKFDCDDEIYISVKYILFL